MCRDASAGGTFTHQVYHGSTTGGAVPADANAYASGAGATVLGDVGSLALLQD